MSNVLTEVFVFGVKSFWIYMLAWTLVRYIDAIGHNLITTYFDKKKEFINGIRSEELSEE